MNPRTLTLLSGAMLLLAAQFPLALWAQEVAPQSPPDVRTQAQEREAVEPAVSNSALSEAPAAAPAATPPAEATPAPQSEAPATRFRTVDRLELESTAITGNRELPKVLYIVPWKKADLGDLVGRPANSLLDEVLTPVDREVFRRQTEYFTKLQSPATQSEQKSEPAPAPR
jgi:hypothetical protein